MVTGKMLEFLIEVAKPGFGALPIASKSDQWPIEEKTPAKVATAKKLKSLSESRILWSEGIVSARNPGKAKPTINRSICFGANPLEVNHFMQRYNPTKDNDDRIE
jgi:hypothetical protein